KTLLRLGFGDSTPPTLGNQGRDQQRLCGDDRQCEGDLPPILAPNGSFCEAYVAACGQPLRVQRPTLQRARVSNASAPDGEHVLTRGILRSSQRFTHEPPDEPSTIFIEFHAACRNSSAYIGLVHAIHRSGRSVAYRPRHVARRILSTIAVTILREIHQ